MLKYPQSPSNLLILRNKIHQRIFIFYRVPKITFPESAFTQPLFCFIIAETFFKKIIFGWETTSYASD